MLVRLSKPRIDEQSTNVPPRRAGLAVCSNPDVSVRIGGVTERRVAREAREHEVERYWPLLVKTWRAYESFFAKMHERAIFVLQRPSRPQLAV